jgi:hypothetical protein
MRSMLGSRLLLALTVTLSAATAYADTVNGGVWQSWSTSNLYGSPSSGTYQSYYWNNFSADGNSNASMNQANIGWTLATGGTYNNPSLTPLANPPGAIPYLSNGNALGSLPAQLNGNPIGNQEAAGTDAPTSISLTSTMPMEAYLRDSITGIKGGSPGILYFGYYLANASGSPNISSMVRLFSSADPTGSTGGIGIAAGQNYGFFVENVQGQGTADQSTFTFFMDAASNTSTGSEAVSGEQHFGLFQQNANDFWIGASGQPDCMVGAGVTPTNSPCADGWAFDYNDFVVELVPAPEPAAIGFVGGALILFSLLFRRRFAAKQ